MGPFRILLFCQAAQAKSFRVICGGLACILGKLKHLGIQARPNKSTPSYANKQCPWEFFRDLFDETLETCRLEARGKKRLRFKNKLLSLDDTTISLCLLLFPWARFRKTKGAVMLLAHEGYLFPCGELGMGWKRGSRDRSADESHGIRRHEDSRYL